MISVYEFKICETYNYIVFPKENNKIIFFLHPTKYKQWTNIDLKLNGEMEHFHKSSWRTH